MTDLHAVPEGGNSLLCEYYLLMQRMIIEGQSKHLMTQAVLIADLQRRLNGEPVTTVFFDACSTS